MTAPPIPQRLAHRPTLGGLVVPYTSIQTTDRTSLGQSHGIKVGQCIVDKLCGVCGQSLDEQPGKRGPYLFLGTQESIDQGFSRDPANHPECAAYSIAACPMLHGGMKTYAKRPHDWTGKPCPDPGCDCGGWVATDPDEDRGGRPAEQWFRIWARDYVIAVREQGPVTVGNLSGAYFKDQIIKHRAVAQIGTP